jgi:GntR family transcriptional regulator
MTLVRSSLEKKMESIVPVYYQIKQVIRNWIINGQFGPGDKIPSEHELAKRFGVTRLTVRQAISQLSQEGFLVSRRGKGTFVTNNEELINRFSLEFVGFMDDLFYHVQKAQTKSVHITKIKAESKMIRSRLLLENEQIDLIRVERERFFRGNPFAYTINYLPMDIGKHIREEDLYKKPMLQILEQDLGVLFTEAFQTIEASFADHEVAGKLGIAPGLPILYVERTMFGKGRKPVELVQTFYRGDMYKYIVRLKPYKGKKGKLWIQNAGA